MTVNAIAIGMLKLKLKLSSKQRFPLAAHEKLCFFCLASSMADTDYITPKLMEQNSLNPQTHYRQKPDPPFSRPLHPQHFVSALLHSKTISQVKQIHGKVLVNGMSENLVVANKLLYIYAQHRALSNAYLLFCDMKKRNSVTWSIILGGFSKVGDFIGSFGIFRKLIQCGVRPDNYNLPFVIRACRDMPEIMSGKIVHGVVVRYGLELNHFVGAALVDMYAKCGVIEDARKLFDDMASRDLVTWTVMIRAYAEFGNPCESLVLFDLMMEESVVPDKFAMVTVVSACAKLGAMNKARVARDYVCRNKLSLDVVLGTAMIDMYSKCGCIESASDVFVRMREKNVVTWSTMIAAYGYHGHGREALDTFDKMLRSGTLPNAITFVSLLYACSHSGLIEEGVRFFASMWDEYSVRPDVKHYTCMVDLLGRAGRVDEAYELVESMMDEKDEGLWCALLGACRIHGHVEMAEKAANSLMQLQPHNPGHYVLLSNVYAKAGRWKDVAKIRNLMTQSRLKKVPGWTWIEVDNKIYQFSSGDETHPRSKEIYGMLKDLNEKLVQAGYVPDTSFILQDVDEEDKVRILSTHSEKLAIAFALVATPSEIPIRLTKNLRICGDCHTFSKFVSAVTERVIIVRDANRFHHFKEGVCSCGDYW